MAPVVNVVDLLNQWSGAGMDYVLAFLLVFAVVFGVLTATNILGKHKGVHVIIALVVSLMSLQGGLVVNFFNAVFSRTGVAIAVILVLVILTAVFVPKEHWEGWAIGLYSVGGIAFLFVIFNAFSDLNWIGSDFWNQYGGLLVGALLVVGVIIAVSLSGNKSDKPKTHRDMTHGQRYPDD